MAVMESDLAALQSHRVKREQEVTSERALTDVPPNTDLFPKLQRISTHLVSEEKLPGDDAEVADAIMADPVPEVEIPIPSEQSKTNADNLTKTELSDVGKGSSPEPPPEVQQVSIKDPTTGGEVAVKAQPGDGDARNATGSEMPPPDETQATVNIKDIDFDSMFDDTVGDGSNDNIDFDMDFPTHVANSEALLGDDPFGTNVSRGNVLNIPAGTTEDIDSLLPGLESFANATDDFAVVNIGTISASAESAMKAAPTSKSAAKGADAPPDLLPPESNFDDMFFGSVDFALEEGNGGGDGGDDFGELGDFDESWFKTDGT